MLPHNETGYYYVARLQVYLHEHLPNDDVIVIGEQGAKDDSNSILLCCNIPVYVHSDIPLSDAK